MPSLDNFRLVVFRAVASHCSFRKAAEELYLTQPAVSLQIKALEQDIGVQLFDRTGTRILLSPAGELLLRYAQQSHTLLARAEQEIAALTGTHAGHLALGASTTIAQYVLPRLLGDFARLHPRVHLTLISGNTDHIVRALLDRTIALGLIEGPARTRDLKTQPFLSDELVLLVSAAHEWAELPSIPAADLATAPFLMREHGSGTRRILELALTRHGIKPKSLRILMELDSTEAIKSAVEAGLGIGFVSRWAVAKDLRLNKAFKIVDVHGLRIHRNFLLATPTTPNPNPLTEDFSRYLRTNTHTK
jgi:DNA-binding transcriptional LysR family regulator